MSVAAIAPLAGADPAPLVLQLGPVAAPASAPAGFADLLVRGLQRADAQVASADALARRFAIDDSVPVHQVTMALEEARLSVELAMQVRARMVEAYRELMNMQL